ncbi:hypothetical protein, partial [Ruminiclostridium hungatei]|uniref:hypothetical protein n=1 Tax=Ruminiclostridium hungatei TaxID=48256 RepID=UPI001055ADFD
MYNIFEEYNIKDLSNRVSLEFVRDREGLLNPWQISNFIGRLSSYYYKIELINTVALALQYGVKPNSIFILDESFKASQYYNNLYDINLFSDDILHLYNIGKPISLFPNRTIL